ncbi:MAG: phosphate ABC transporter ATP-binding protein [Deltaproteobacteria bacterium]|nr:phosphate ABC transporter ATP-binding protein [Deltaproteobacteria bacterium]
MIEVAEDILTAVGVHLNKGGVAVLEDVSFSLVSGHIHAIIGPNGAGKTSLLRLIGLLDRLDQGQVIFGGRAVSPDCPDILTVRRQMAMIHQSPMMFNSSAYHNVSIGLKFRRTPRAEIDRKVNRAFDFVSLNGFGPRAARSLSGGEAQRVALARAIAVEPLILLADEPTANLDPRNTLVIENLIRRLNRERRVSVVMVTHDLGQAGRLADEVTFMAHGRVVETGPADQVMNFPRHELTRTFLNRGLVL